MYWWLLGRYGGVFVHCNKKQLQQEYTTGYTREYTRVIHNRLYTRIYEKDMHIQFMLLRIMTILNVVEFGGTISISKYELLNINKTACYIFNVIDQICSIG